MNSHKFRQRTSCVRKILSLYFVSSRVTHRLLPSLRSVIFVVPKSKLLPQQPGICCCDATDPRHEPSALFGHSFAAVTRTAERQDTIFLSFWKKAVQSVVATNFPRFPGSAELIRTELGPLASGSTPTNFLSDNHFPGNPGTAQQARHTTARDWRKGLVCHLGDALGNS